jgi:hypothetical protein
MGFDELDWLKKTFGDLLSTKKKEKKSSAQNISAASVVEELDDETINMIKEVVAAKRINTIWFEAHYMYRNRLAGFARQFAPATVKFRCGVESFDPQLRSSWDKGIPAGVTAADVAKYFKGVCLLCCTVGDSKERILNDIATAKRHFEYFSVNLFCNNTTAVKRDEELAVWFVNELYPTLKDDRQIEVLVENCDLGVGQQEI